MVETSEPSETPGASKTSKATSLAVVRFRAGDAGRARDWVAVERPLEIRARVAGVERAVSTTMRTPGNDGALAAGFLFGEGVISDGSQIRALESLGEDVVLVELAPEAERALAATQRVFVTTGACGVCGRTSMDDLLAVIRVGSGDVGLQSVTADMVCGLPTTLRSAQATFARTGGLHAAGLFTTRGELLIVHEDVGRHNAVDKLVGTLLLAGQLPAAEGLLMLSGRASFELVQKAARAGIPILAAVGAPSTLAVEIARRARMTLLGFVRDGGFNAYCGEDRVLK